MTDARDDKAARESAAGPGGRDGPAMKLAETLARRLAGRLAEQRGERSGGR